MSDPLDGWDDNQARIEGWFVHEYAGEVGGITAFASSAFFREASYPKDGEADAKALAFVQQRAREGSAYHIEALARTQLL